MTTDAAGRPGRAPAWFAAAALAAIWFPPLLRFARAWGSVPEDRYGWGVPFLALLLLAERWRRRPAQGTPGGAAAWVVLAAGLVLLAASLPVLEANELWPTAQAGAFCGVLAATLAFGALAGGWAWAGHFAFPLAFVSTSLIWPTDLHLWVVRDLAGMNAGLAAGIVSVLGHPAIVNGNVITVATGRVGVDEACSGLRSLQAIWMAGWFFGEFHGLTWPRRIALVAAALAAGILANLLRTTFLTWEAAARGLAACEAWHDRAAALELVGALGAVVLIAEAVKGRSGQAAEPAGTTPAPVRWRLAPSVVLIAVAFAAETGTQAWYLAHERWGQSERVHWQLASPSPDWRPIDIPARAQAVLNNTSATGFTWSDPIAGLRGWAYVVSWIGDAAQGENPEWHDPTICLPAAGVKFEANLDPVRLDVGGAPIVFAGYRFEAANRPLIVYFCHWDAQVARARSEADAVDLRIRRLERVRDGRRRGDVAHITFVLEGAGEAQALAWLRTWAPRLLQPKRF